MARIRTIKPEFWSSPKVGLVSRDARLLFIGLLNEADDEGRLLGQTKRLAGIIFPYDEDIDGAKVSELLLELERGGLVNRYDVSGAVYLSIRGFMDHQKIDKRTASKLPPPPSISTSSVPPDNSGETSDRSVYPAREMSLEQGTGKGIKEVERVVVVVDESLSFGSFLYQDIANGAGKLSNALPKLHQEKFRGLVWQIAYVALEIEGSHLIDQFIRSVDRNAKNHPTDYLEGAIRQACIDRGFDWHRKKMEAPQCPLPHVQSPSAPTNEKEGLEQ